MSIRWPVTTVGETCTLVSGGTPSKANAAFWHGSIPWVSAKDLKTDRIDSAELFVSNAALESSATKLAPIGSLLVLVRGMGLANGVPVCEVTSPVAFNQDIRAVLTPRSLLPRFLQLWLRDYFSRASGDILSAAAHGTLKVDTDALKAVPVPVPPLAEQRRIVGILDEAFEGIATAKANAEQNVRNARALLESHLESVLTQKGLGWVERDFSEVCSITSALVDPRQDEYRSLIHVGAANIESRTGAFVELKTAEEEGLISGKFPFDESMVLYSKIRPYLMKVGRPDFSGLCSADMYPLRPSPDVVTRDYLFYLLLSTNFTEYAVRGSARAGMPKVNREHLFAYRASLPSVQEQHRIAADLDGLSVSTKRLAGLYEAKLANLDALKTSLLHQAFSGQL